MTPRRSLPCDCPEAPGAAEARCFVDADVAAVDLDVEDDRLETWLRTQLGTIEHCYRVAYGDARELPTLETYVQLKITQSARISMARFHARSQRAYTGTLVQCVQEQLGRWDPRGRYNPRSPLNVAFKLQFRPKLGCGVAPGE